MTEKSIFEQNDITKEDYDNPGESFVENNEDSLVETLVGEGRKFKSVEDLAKGKVLADSFIERLKEENRSLREKTSKLETDNSERLKIEDLIKELRTGQTMNNGNNTPAENPNDSKTVSVDYDAIVNKVMADFEERSKNEKAANAVRTVSNYAKEVFGANWQEGLLKIGNDLGLDREMIDLWVKKNPEAVINKIKEKDSRTRVPTQDPSPSIMSSGLTLDSGTTVRNKAYYDKLKAKDPKAYWSSAIQIQKHKDAQRLQEKFFV